MLGKGKKTRAWEATRRNLKVRFEAAGITRCELCGGTFALSWGHRYKRRFITTQEELETVALLDQACHTRIEAMSHAEMKRIVDEIIAARETPV